MIKAALDFKKGDLPDIIAGIVILGEVLGNLTDNLKDCEGMQDDIKRIHEWAQIFNDKPKLIEMVVKNTIENFDKVKEDAMKAYYEGVYGLPD